MSVMIIMTFEKGKYYHLYNRTNNQELLFHDDDNYQFFLSKFQHHLSTSLSVIAYCLMPTHFHFLIRIESDDSLLISKNIAVLLRSYTRAINKRFNRNGNLFQQNTKAKKIADENYLLTLISYIHQNPLRVKKCDRLKDWKYSSYQDLITIHAITQSNISDAMTRSHGITIDQKFYEQYFKTTLDFKKYSEEMVVSVKKDFWV